MRRRTDRENIADSRTVHVDSFAVEIWKNGFSKEAPELRLGKPGSGPGLPVKAERRVKPMIKVLVVLPLIGRFTIIIVWHRKGQR